MASTNQSPTSLSQTLGPVNSKGECQINLPQIRLLRIHIQRSNNNSSRPLQQDQQQSTTCGSNRLYKTPPPPNRSVSREPSMSMSMRHHNAPHHHQPVYPYGPMVSAESSPNSRSGRAATALNGRGTSINGDEPKSLSQFNPATIDTHSVHSRRTLASNRVRCGSCLNLAPNVVESNPEGALVLYDSRQSMSPGNMLNPFMTPPPFWQYPQFGMAPAPPPFYFPHHQLRLILRLSEKL